MISKTYELRLENGIHARPAGLLVKAVGTLDSHVILRLGEREINAKSIMAVISSGMKLGTVVEVVCDGPQEAEALEAVDALFAVNFNE